jgi:glutathionyl-hydroquinone reductase
MDNLIVQYASPYDKETYGSYYAQNGSAAHNKGETFVFTQRIGSPEYPAECGRYHVYLQYVCPWSHRVQIIIDYLGLNGAVTYSYLDNLRDGRGWAFREQTGHDPINGFTLLSQAYYSSNPDFKGIISVPATWDRRTNRLISNCDNDMVYDFGTQFSSLQTAGIDIYPQGHQAEIDSLVSWISEKLTAGVYELIFADEQTGYDLAVNSVYTALDDLEARLARSRYLLGDTITMPDICLFPTLVRFDLIYYPLFRAFRRRLIDYPNLWAYSRDLYTIPAFRAGIHFDHIKQAYCSNFEELLYKNILPASPIVDWDQPQERALIVSA